MRTHEDVRSWYGWAELSPGDPIVAGSLGRWRLTYHAGRYGIAAGGALKLAFRRASDWGTFQGKDPYDRNFLTVTTSGRALLSWRFDPRGYRDPWPRAVTVDVARWGLAEGDTVVFYLGDPEGGSPGCQAQTFCERGHELRVLVDPFASGHFLAVPSPVVDVVPGEPARLVLTAPSQVAAGQPFALTLCLVDRWGNPAPGGAGQARLWGLPAVQSARLEETPAGAGRLEGQRLDHPGVHRLRARVEGLGLVAESNPIRVRPADSGEWLPLWGDLRGQCGETGGTNPADAYFRYARDVAGLDFCAHQGDAHRTPAAAWQRLQQAVRQENDPGRFAAILGYSWAANTAAGGSRGVLFPGDRGELRRPCQTLVDDPGPAADCYPLSALYQALRGQDALVVVNAGEPPPSLDHHDPELERLIEVYSAWGEFPWLLEEALQRGWRVGFVASSGDPLGRPGASSPGATEMVGRGGLTCVYARDRSREAIWEALKARRSYATTGERILLEVHADDHAMGEAYAAARPPRLTVRVAATAEIERVEIRRGLEVAYRYPEREAARAGWLRLRWGGALGRDWPRVAPWDGTLRLQGATLRTVQPYGFATAARGIVLQNARSVSWRSATAGNENGLVLELAEAEPGARLEFYAPLVTLSLPLGELPREKALGGERLFVRAEPLPAGTGQRDLELTWQETELRPGVTPYYVTVLQADGGKAWSSPIYVEGP